MSRTKPAPCASDRTREMRYQQAALLLKEWLADDSEYDARAWEYLWAELHHSTVQSEASRPLIDSEHGKDAQGGCCGKRNDC
jgi:hypothetical protein